MFPVPQIRDNLIRWDGQYSDENFCNDIFGEIFPDYTRKVSVSSLETESTWTMDDEDNDDVAARRQGMIVWGEPSDISSWEVTPGFVRKWGFLLEGCEELMVASNRWRTTRNEKPLQLVF